MQGDHQKDIQPKEEKPVLRLATDWQRLLYQPRPEGNQGSSSHDTPSTGLAHRELLETRGIKRERSDPPNIPDSPAIKRERTASPEIKPEHSPSPEIRREAATFKEAGTRVDHENRTFYFSRPLDFVQITKDNTPLVYATDRIDSLREEMGNQHPWERVEPPNSLPHGQVKLYTPLYAVKGFGDDHLHLFDQPQTLRNAYPEHKLIAKKISSMGGGPTNLLDRPPVFHKGFSPTFSSDREALRNDGIPLMHQEL